MYCSLHKEEEQAAYEPEMDWSHEKVLSRRTHGDMLENEMSVRSRHNEDSINKAGKPSLSFNTCPDAVCTAVLNAAQVIQSSFVHS